MLSKTTTKAKKHRVPWTKMNDELLCHAIEDFGKGKWNMIASIIPGVANTRTDYQTANNLLIATTSERNNKACEQHWEKVLNPRLVKGRWMLEEYNLMLQLTPKIQSWREISLKLGTGRTAKQCRERWKCSLVPRLKRTPLTAGEDKILLDMRAQQGAR